MLWVTRDHLHLDRVACCWLIGRFVDAQATFAFLGAGGDVPQGAVPFALPGAEVGPHDERGSAFRKVLHRHGVSAAELDRMADCVEVGIATALGRPVPDAAPVLQPIGQAMAWFAESMAVVHADDDSANLVASIAFYDAVYVRLWTAHGGGPVPLSNLRDRIAGVRASRNWAALLPTCTPQTVSVS